jgi:RNA polymerase sigma-70 factor (ECF subfamily)
LRLTGEHRPSIAPSAEHRRLAERFLTVVGTGDAAQVAALLADDVIWDGDGGGKRLASTRPVIGADRVSRGWVGLMRKLAQVPNLTWQVIDLNGAPAVLGLNDGAVDRALLFDVRDGQIAAVRTILALDKLDHLARSLGLEVAEPFEWSIPGRPRPLVPRAARESYSAPA